MSIAIGTTDIIVIIAVFLILFGGDIIKLIKTPQKKMKKPKKSIKN